MRVSRTPYLTVVVGLAAWLAVSCTSTNSAIGPSSQIDLSGTWRGNFVIQGIATEMVWTLSQSGSSVSGPVLVRLPDGVVLLNGTFSGTLTGSTLPYTIAIGPGGIPSQPACTGQLAGTMTATLGTVSTLAGNYGVASATCTPPFDATGNFSLTR